LIGERHRYKRVFSRETSPKKKKANVGKKRKLKAKGSVSYWGTSVLWVPVAREKRSVSRGSFEVFEGMNNITAPENSELSVNQNCLKGEGDIKDAPGGGEIKLVKGSVEDRGNKTKFVGVRSNVFIFPKRNPALKSTYVITGTTSSSLGET